MNAIKKKKLLGDFVKKEKNNLIRYVNRFFSDTSDMDVEDIIQDVLLNIFEKSNIVIPIERLGAYIYQSLRNKIIDTFRTKKEPVLSIDADIKNENEASLYDVLSDVRYEAASDYEKRRMNELLYKALDSLKPEEKAIIISTEFENKTYRQLSEELDKPVGTLLAKKSRALDKIRKYIVKINQYESGG